MCTNNKVIQPYKNSQSESWAIFFGSREEKTYTCRETLKQKDTEFNKKRTSKDSGSWEQKNERESATRSKRKIQNERAKQSEDPETKTDVLALCSQEAYAFPAACVGSSVYIYTTKQGPITQIVMQWDWLQFKSNHIQMHQTTTSFCREVLRAHCCTSSLFSPVLLVSLTKWSQMTFPYSINYSCCSHWETCERWQCCYIMSIATALSCIRFLHNHLRTDTVNVANQISSMVKKLHYWSEGHVIHAATLKDVKQSP